MGQEFTGPLGQVSQANYNYGQELDPATGDPRGGALPFDQQLSLYTNSGGQGGQAGFLQDINTQGKPYGMTAQDFGIGADVLMPNYLKYIQNNPNSGEAQAYNDNGLGSLAAPMNILNEQWASQYPDLKSDTQFNADGTYKSETVDKLGLWDKYGVNPKADSSIGGLLNSMPGKLALAVATMGATSPELFVGEGAEFASGVDTAYDVGENLVNNPAAFGQSAFSQGLDALNTGRSVYDTATTLKNPNASGVQKAAAVLGSGSQLSDFDTSKLLNFSSGGKVADFTDFLGDGGMSTAQSFVDPNTLQAEPFGGPMSVPGNFDAGTFSAGGGATAATNLFNPAADPSFYSSSGDGTQGGAQTTPAGAPAMLVNGQSAPVPQSLSAGTLSLGGGVTPAAGSPTGPSSPGGFIGGNVDEFGNPIDDFGREALKDPSATDAIKKLAGKGADWAGNNPLTLAKMGIAGYTALHKTPLTDTQKTLANQSTAGASAATAMIQSGGTGGPQWTQQKASIDASIDQQIQQAKQQILQNAQNSGQGADSQVTVQQIQKMQQQAETMRQQQYMAAQQQNVQTALSQLGISDSGLQSVANAEFQNNKQAQSTASDTAQLALMMNQMQKPTATAGASA